MTLFQALFDTPSWYKDASGSGALEEIKKRQTIVGPGIYQGCGKAAVVVLGIGAVLVATGSKEKYGVLALGVVAACAYAVLRVQFTSQKDEIMRIHRVITQKSV